MLFTEADLPPPTHTHTHTHARTHTGESVFRPPRLSLPGGMHLPDSLHHLPPHPFQQHQQLQQQQQALYPEGNTQAASHPSTLGVLDEGGSQPQEDVAMDTGHEEGAQGRAESASEGGFDANFVCVWC